MRKIENQMTKCNTYAGKITFKTNKRALFGIGKENIFGLALAANILSSQIGDITDMICNNILESKGYDGNYYNDNDRVRLGSSLSRSAVMF